MIVKLKNINELEKMTKEDIVTYLEQSVYNVCLIFEQLEGLNKIRGNGHHIAQDISHYTKKELLNRWRE